MFYEQTFRGSNPNLYAVLYKCQVLCNLCLDGTDIKFEEDLPRRFLK